MSEHIHNSDRITGSVGEARHHDSALKHVTGQARYVDDIAVPNGTLHLAVGGCDTTAGDIIAINLDAVRNAPGVVAVLTADDIAGTNDVSPLHLGDDPILADKQVRFHGEAVFAVLAQSYRAARAAARLGHIETTQATPVVTVDEAMAVGAELSERQEMTRGDWHAALAAAPQRAQGTLRIGGQDHFYLEGQISLALPMEDGDVHIHCSTQHPTEVQIAVARVLGRAANAVTVEVRRMGGAFGGKETQAAQWAALAALGAVQTGRPVKCRLDRDDDMILTGKRHDFARTGKSASTTTGASWALTSTLPVAVAARGTCRMRSTIGPCSILTMPTSSKPCTSPRPACEPTRSLIPPSVALAVHRARWRANG